MINLKNKIILAPLLGVNCNAFMINCKENGADIVYTGMLDCQKIIDGSINLDFPKQIRPVVGQLIGSKPEEFAQATKILEKHVDAIDVNFGCCESEMLNRRAGAYLLQYPEKMTEILKAVRASTEKQLFVKIRSGWNDSSNIDKLVQACILGGVEAICIHPRTKKQRYSTNADWNLIRKVKELSTVPVIASGDIVDAESAKKVYQQTQCDAIMIGRAAMGDPDLFKRLKGALMKRTTYPHPGTIRKKKMFLEFHELYKKHDDRNLNELKTHALWFFSKIRAAKTIKQAILAIDSEEELIDFVNSL